MANNTVQIVVNLRDNASGALSSITSSLQGMATVAGGIIAADVLGGLARGFAGFATMGFDGARSIENATAKLNAFTKDSEESTRILDMLNEESSKTPFAFQEMADAGTSLLPIANSLNMDLMDLVHTAEILAASNPAEGLAGAAFALREAASGDFASVIERFNLSRVYINQLKEEGVPNLEIISRALANAGYDMELVSNMSETFDGRMSTLKDNVQQVATAFATPIFDYFSEQLFGLGATLEETLPQIKEHAGEIGQFIADTFQTIQEAWSGQWVDSDIIQPMHRLAGTLTQDVKAAWDGLVGAVTAAQGVWQWLVGQWNELNKVGGSWNELMIAGQGLWNTLVGAVDMLGRMLGIAGDEGTENNKAMKDASPLAVTLASIFDSVAKFATFASIGINLVVVGLQAFINWVNSALATWRSLQAAVSGGIAYPQGVPVGGTDVGGTGSTTTGGTTVGGGVGVDPQNRGTMGGGVVIYATVRNDQDINALAYEISKIQKANR
jgi:hypothetical protein